MRKIWLILAVFLLVACGYNSYEPKTGDVVFQDLRSPSSEAIKTATNSPYSHCGIVVVESGSTYVIEAVGPVRRIPLDNWITDGDGQYTVMRLIRDVEFDKAIDEAERYLGFPYDKYYSWDDEKLYCSELVYKAFLRGCGIELCPLRPFESYRLEMVESDILKRFGKIPGELMVVTPADLATSGMLNIVYSNFENR